MTLTENEIARVLGVTSVKPLGTTTIAPPMRPVGEGRASVSLATIAKAGPEGRSEPLTLPGHMARDWQATWYSQADTLEVVNRRQRPIALVRGGEGARISEFDPRVIYLRREPGDQATLVTSGYRATVWSPAGNDWEARELSTDPGLSPPRFERWMDTLAILPAQRLSLARWIDRERWGNLAAAALIHQLDSLAHKLSADSRPLRLSPDCPLDWITGTTSDEIATLVDLAIQRTNALSETLTFLGSDARFAPFDAEWRSEWLGCRRARAAVGAVALLLQEVTSADDLIAHIDESDAVADRVWVEVEDVHPQDAVLSALAVTAPLAWWTDV